VVGLLVLTALLLEGMFRVAYPEPPIQVIRSSVASMRAVDGVPVWEAPDTPIRANHACVARWPAAARVVFVGSSITHGAGVDPEEAFPARIQQSLDAELGAGRVCVQNVAQSGSGFLNKRVALQEALAEGPAALVVWEVWHNDLHDFTPLGGAAYALRDLPVSEDGYPLGPLPAGAAHQWLFRHLRAYEYTTLVMAARDRRPREPEPEILDRIAQVGELCAAADTRLVLLLPPQLDRPFREQPGAGGHVLMEHAARWAASSGVPVVALADVLRQYEHTALRLDPCCHYNPDGHRRVAEALLAHPVLGPLLRAPTTPAGGAGLP